jgi:hypothetical protein
MRKREKGERGHTSTAIDMIFSVARCMSQVKHGSQPKISGCKVSHGVCTRNFSSDQIPTGDVLVQCTSSKEKD